VYDTDYSLPYSAGLGQLTKHGEHWTWETAAGRTLRLSVDQICFPAAFERAFVRQLGRPPWEFRPSPEDWRMFVNRTPVADLSEPDIKGLDRVRHQGVWHWVVLPTVAGQPAKLFPGIPAGKKSAMDFMREKETV
jgi:hypothetical protein